MSNDERLAHRRMLDAARASRYRKRKRPNFAVHKGTVWELDTSDVTKRLEAWPDGSMRTPPVTSSYVMKCACGRSRWAPAQCLHEVSQCRVCRATTSRKRVLDDTQLDGMQDSLDVESSVDGSLDVSDPSA